MNISPVDQGEQRRESKDESMPDPSTPLRSVQGDSEGVGVQVELSDSLLLAAPLKHPLGDIATRRGRCFHFLFFVFPMKKKRRKFILL